MLTAPRVLHATCLLRREREKSGRILFVPKESNSFLEPLFPTLVNLCVQVVSANPKYIKNLQNVPEEIRQSLLNHLRTNYKVGLMGDRRDTY